MPSSASVLGGKVQQSLIGFGIPHDSGHSALNRQVLIFFETVRMYTPPQSENPIDDFGLQICPVF
jgi:hypothetical protein